jgi:hypothetical protein
VTLSEISGKHIPDESTLRKGYVKPLYIEKIEKIRSTVDNNNVYFIIDETTDRAQNFVINTLVGVLNGNPTKPMLLSTCFVEETDNSTIISTFMHSCQILWPEKIYFSKVLLVVTDQASYMVKALKNLKEGSFTNLHHVTCLAHE